MKFLSLLVLSLITLNLLAADSSGNYAIWGSGNKSCHKYSLSRAAGEDDQYKNYIMGYLTAYNNLADETYSISGSMNLSEVMVWLDEECDMKPVIAFEDSLIDFIIEHYEDRMKYPPGGFSR